MSLLSSAAQLAGLGAAVYFGGPSLAAAFGEGGALASLPAGTLPAAATLAGSVMTNSTNMDIASDQRDFSAQQAATTYSRGAADMARAGLNPILAYANPAQVGAYQQPQIQNSLGLASQAAVTAHGVEASAYRDTEQGHTTKGTRPGEIKKLDTVNKKLLAEIEQISFQNKLAQAHTAESVAREGLTKAQTSVATAQSATERQRVLNLAAEESLTKTMERFREGEIGLQKVQQILMYADVALKSAQAKSALSSEELSRAQKLVSDMEYWKRQPESAFNYQNPKFSTFLHGMKEVMRTIPGLSLLMKE